MASREANGRKTRLLVWVPHICWGWSGAGLFYFSGGGASGMGTGLLTWAKLRKERDDDDTLDDLFLFAFFLFSCLTISRKLHSSQMHDFMTFSFCSTRGMLPSPFASPDGLIFFTDVSRWEHQDLGPLKGTNQCRLNQCDNAPAANPVIGDMERQAV